MRGAKKEAKKTTPKKPVKTPVNKQALAPTKTIAKPARRCSFGGKNKNPPPPPAKTPPKSGKTPKKVAPKAKKGQMGPNGTVPPLSMPQVGTQIIPGIMIEHLIEEAADHSLLYGVTGGGLMVLNPDGSGQLVMPGGEHDIGEEEFDDEGVYDAGPFVHSHQETSVIKTAKAKSPANKTAAAKKRAKTVTSGKKTPPKASAKKAIHPKKSAAQTKKSPVKKTAKKSSKNHK